MRAHPWRLQMSRSARRCGSPPNGLLFTIDGIWRSRRWSRPGMATSSASASFSTISGRETRSAPWIARRFSSQDVSFFLRVRNECTLRSRGCAIRFPSRSYRPGQWSYFWPCWMSGLSLVLQRRTSKRSFGSSKDGSLRSQERTDALCKLLQRTGRTSRLRRSQSCPACGDERRKTLLLRYLPGRLEWRSCRASENAVLRGRRLQEVSKSLRLNRFRRRRRSQRRSKPRATSPSSWRPALKCPHPRQYSPSAARRATSAPERRLDGSWVRWPPPPRSAQSSCACEANNQMRLHAMARGCTPLGPWLPRPEKLIGLIPRPCHLPPLRLQSPCWSTHGHRLSPSM